MGRNNSTLSRNIGGIIGAAILVALFSGRVHAADSQAALASARAALARGGVDSALMVLKEALNQDSLNVPLLLALADAQEMKGQGEPSRSTLGRVMALDSLSAAAQVRLARHFFARNVSDSASYFAHRALMADRRNSPETYYILGRLHERSDRPDSAIIYYQRAYSLMAAKELF